MREKTERRRDESNEKDDIVNKDEMQRSKGEEQNGTKQKGKNKM